MASRRRAVPSRVASQAAAAVAGAVLLDPAIRGARRVGLYAAYGGELDTRALFDALGPERERLLPRVRGGRLEWVRLEAWEDLASGRLGFPEPPGDEADHLAPGDVALLPGLAFDALGWRLGRGGGFYDRAFPPGTAAPWLVGIGYAFQIVDAVPHDSRDRRVDAIVTERGWMRLRGEER